ncbi:MAG TPA: hypothetical protein PLZ74_01730 [Kiritimatiellia bacterium]|jgi:hypothetical protein|nr:hypothetical protein [Kiritimatiellia bacterium]
MMGTLILLLGAFISAWLAFVPCKILLEIRRQGAAREAEALRVVALLVSIDSRLAGSPPAATPAGAPPPADPLQAAIDARAAGRP